MREYALALCADRKTDFGASYRIVAGYAVASNTDEAVGMALREAKERFPVSEGWRNHDATAFEIQRVKVPELEHA